MFYLLHDLLVTFRIVSTIQGVICVQMKQFSFSSVSIVNISSFISITTLSLFFTGPISTPAAFLSIRYYAVIIIHVAPQIKQQQSKHLWLQSPLTPGTLVGKDDLLLFWFSSGQSLSRVWLSVTPWTTATRLLHPWDFPGKSTGAGCHCLLHNSC